MTTNTLVSNLETTIGEKERLIEKLREQKHTLDIGHQEEIEQLQKTLNETRLKLEQKEKDYYEGQVKFRFFFIKFYLLYLGSGYKPFLPVEEYLRALYIIRSMTARLTSLEH
jgi:hypothetical protein